MSEFSGKKFYGYSLHNDPALSTTTRNFEFTYMRPEVLERAIHKVQNTDGAGKPKKLTTRKIGKGKQDPKSAQGAYSRDIDVETEVSRRDSSRIRSLTMGEVDELIEKAKSTSEISEQTMLGETAIRGVGDGFNVVHDSDDDTCLESLKKKISSLRQEVPEMHEMNDEPEHGDKASETKIWRHTSVEEVRQPMPKWVEIVEQPRYGISVKEEVFRPMRSMAKAKSDSLQRPGRAKDSPHGPPRTVEDLIDEYDNYNPHAYLVEDSDLEYELSHRQEYAKHCEQKPDECTVNLSQESGGIAEFVEVEKYQSYLPAMEYIKNVAPMRYSDLTEETCEEHYHTQQISVTIKKNKDESSSPKRLGKGGGKKHAKDNSLEVKPLEETIIEKKREPKKSEQKKFEHNKLHSKAPHTKREQPKLELPKRDHSKWDSSQKDKTLMYAKAEYTKVGHTKSGRKERTEAKAPESPTKRQTALKAKRADNQISSTSSVPSSAIRFNTSPHPTTPKSTTTGPPSLVTQKNTSPGDRKKVKAKVLIVTRSIEDLKKEKAAIFLKMTQLQEDIIELLDKIRRNLLEMYIPDTSSENSRRRKNAFEFSVRFSRNFLYPLKSMMEHLKATPVAELNSASSNDACGRVASIYTLLHHSLVTYQKQLRYFLLDQVPQKLSTLIEMIYSITVISLDKRVFDRKDLVVDCMQDRCLKFLAFLKDIHEERFLAARDNYRKLGMEKAHKHYDLKMFMNNLNMYEPMLVPKKHQRTRKFVHKKVHDSQDVGIEKSADHIWRKPVESSVATRMDVVDNEESSATLMNSTSLVTELVPREETCDESAAGDDININKSIFSALQMVTKEQVRQVLEPIIQSLGTTLHKKPKTSEEVYEMINTIDQNIGRELHSKDFCLSKYFPK